MGNLVVTQNTSLPWPNYLAKTALKISFLLHDPSNFFKTASFLYSWDFGDGYVLTPLDAPMPWPTAVAPLSHAGCFLLSHLHLLTILLRTFLEHLPRAKLWMYGDEAGSQSRDLPSRCLIKPQLVLET